MHEINGYSAEGLVVCEQLAKKFDSRFCRISYRSHDDDDHLFFMKLVHPAHGSLDMDHRGYATWKTNSGDIFRINPSTQWCAPLFDRFYPMWRDKRANELVALEILGDPDKVRFPTKGLLTVLAVTALIFLFTSIL